MRVVIAGGGVAGLEAMLALHDLAGDRVQITLVAPNRHFRHRAASIAELFDHGVVEELDLRETAVAVGATFRQCAVRRVDGQNREAETTAAERLSFDALLVATGAKQISSIPGALMLTDDMEDARRFRDAFNRGELRRVTFVMPGGNTWPIPIYEMALFAATRAADMRIEVEISLVTSEERPLALFGRPASEAISSLLDANSVRVVSASTAIAFDNGELRLTSNKSMTADQVVALPHLRGVAVDGVPADANQFIRAGADGRVPGLSDVFAAGDATSFPVKQGGIAAEQADVVARAIARIAGVDVAVEPFRPVLRGKLLTGSGSWFIRSEIWGGRGETTVFSSSALWWPPSKVAAPFLSRYIQGRGAVETVEPATDGHPVTITLDPPHSHDSPRPS